MDEEGSVNLDWNVSPRKLFNSRVVGSKVLAQSFLNFLEGWVADFYPKKKKTKRIFELSGCLY